MLKKTIIALSLSTALFSMTFQEYQAQQKKEFTTYKVTQEEEFNKYKEEQMKVYNQYKKELSNYWQEPKLSSKHSWIAYSKDEKSRTDVDFKKGTIKVEVISNSKEDAEAKIKKALKKVVTINTQEVQKEDTLQQRLKKIKKPKDVIDDKVNAEPILSTIFFNKKPTQTQLNNFVTNTIQKKPIEVKKSPKIEHQKVYSVEVKMPSNYIIKRSKIYESEVRKQAKRQTIPLPLVFAIIHSESSFNPLSTSHIPAYGLMQIVPKTAGIDTYRYLYKKKRLVTASYLYNSNNNITMGAGYLHILYYSYLKSIKNPDSRLYCAIAAYNTGAGNIAYAFNRYKSYLTKRQMYRMKYAAKDINALTPDEVYARLMKDLRWDEPKNYLKRVSRRMSIYHKLYGL
jgi:membrane-bound lytic murein transglycosylase C